MDAGPGPTSAMTASTSDTMGTDTGGGRTGRGRGSAGTGKTEEQRAREKRERNKLAARRCRMKKSNQMQTLEQVCCGHNARMRWGRRKRHRLQLRLEARAASSRHIGNQLPSMMR